MTIKQIFEDLKQKSNPFQNRAESQEFWAELGQKAYDLYLKDEYDLKDILNEEKRDSNFLYSLLDKKTIKGLSKRLKEKYDQTT